MNESFVDPDDAPKLTSAWAAKASVFHGERLIREGGVAIQADPSDPEDGDVTFDGLCRALAERQSRQDMRSDK